MNNDTLTTLAVNTGNMIASLNLEIAQRIVENNQLKQENQRLKDEVTALKMKKVTKIEPDKSNSHNQ